MVKTVQKHSKLCPSGCQNVMEAYLDGVSLWERYDRRESSWKYLPL